MLDVQIVLISACENRKTLIKKQFEELNITIPLHFLDASTPANSSDYLPEHYGIALNKIICCGRSHVRAIEFASRETSPEFTIIMEDDAAIHKTHFKDIVSELIEKWDKYVESHSKIISLGWIPLRKYEEYLDIKSEYIFDCSLDSKILLQNAIGLQAYMLKRQTAKDLTALMYHSTYYKFRDTLRNDIKNNKLPLFTDEWKDYSMISIDHVLNKVILQCVIFPPIIIEQRLPSLIEHSNEVAFWKNFFSNYEHERLHYWSFN